MEECGLLEYFELPRRYVPTPDPDIHVASHFQQATNPVFNQSTKVFPIGASDVFPHHKCFYCTRTANKRPTYFSVRTLLHQCINVQRTDRLPEMKTKYRAVAVRFETTVC